MFLHPSLTNASNLLVLFAFFFFCPEPSHGSYFLQTSVETIVNCELPLTAICPTLVIAPNEQEERNKHYIILLTLQNKELQFDQMQIVVQ